LWLAGGGGIGLMTVADDRLIERCWWQIVIGDEGGRW